MHHYCTGKVAPCATVNVLYKETDKIWTRGALSTPFGWQMQIVLAAPVPIMCELGIALHILPPKRTETTITSGLILLSRAARVSTSTP